jgi:uncharacterized protein YbaR (Trm112 family)
MIPQELMDILVCPACRGDLREEDPVLVCTECGLRYPVRDGIPIMLVEEATRPGDS